jgi:hypothetical protein
LTLYNEINHLSLSSNGVMKFSLHLIFHLMYTFKFWSHVWLNGPRTFAYFHFYIFKYFQEEKDSLISPFAFSTSFSISFRLFKLNFHLGYVLVIWHLKVTFVPSSFKDIYQQNVPTKILLFHLLCEFFIDKNLCWDLKTSENLKFEFLLTYVTRFDRQIRLFLMTKASLHPIFVAKSSESIEGRKQTGKTPMITLA